MKTLKAQVIISLITCFFLVLAVTICKGNKFGNILSESENTTESQTGTSGSNQAIQRCTGLSHL